MIKYIMVLVLKMIPMAMKSAILISMASSSPKDITTIRNGVKEAFVFEGFIDFLSFMAINKNQAVSESDFVILNSVSFFEKARVFMAA